MRQIQYMSHLYFTSVDGVVYNDDDGVDQLSLLSSKVDMNVSCSILGCLGDTLYVDVVVKSMPLIPFAILYIYC